MEDILEDAPQESQDHTQETPVADVFIPPSVQKQRVLSGTSYTYHSAIPKTIKDDVTTECVLGVDEAGRGPVLGTHSSICEPSGLIFCRTYGVRLVLLAAVITSFVVGRHPQIR